MNIAYEVIGITFAFFYTFVSFRLLFWSILGIQEKQLKMEILMES